MKKTIVITAIGILGLIASQTQAALIEIAIEAEVTTVDDPGNLLEGKVNVGNTITGSYKYDSETPDSSPDDPVQGNYWNYSPPYGVSLNVGGFNFKTELNDVEFLIFTRNNLGTGHDRFGFGSYNNMPLSNGIPLGTITWLLEDSTGSELQNDHLPLIAPILDHWDYDNSLSIEGGERTGDFMIIGEVTSAVLIPEPASITLFTFGCLIIRKRRSKS